MFTRGHDALPVLMRFGAMHAELEPHARFLIKVATPEVGRERWKAVPLAEYPRLYPHGSIDSGIIDVWAAWYELHWQTADEDSFVVSHRRTFLAPPTVLEKGNSSTIYDAVDTLNDLAEVTQAWLLVQESRMQLFLTAKYKELVLGCCCCC